MNDRHIRAEKIVSDLTKGSIPKSIFSLAIPMIIANTLTVALELIDAFFVGQLGSEILAAVSMAGVVIFFLATIGAGLGIGAVALISHASGERDFEKANRIAVQSLYIGTIIALLIGIFGFIASPVLMKFLGADGIILETGTEYLKILFVGLFTMFFMFVGAAVFQGAGDTATPMKISALATLLNIVLDPIMIFGLLGFPRMEASGAALATVISRSTGSLIMVYILLRGKHAVHLKLRYLHFDFGIIKEILVVGLPGSIQMLLRSLSAVVLIKIAAVFGSIVVAVYGVGARLFHFFLFPGFGFGAAAATLVGQNLGAKNPDRASKSAMLSSFYYLIFLLSCGGLVFIFAPSIARIFNQEKEFIRIGTVFFRFIAVGSVFLSSGVVFSRALQGAGDTVTPMLVTGFSLYAVQIPLAYLFSNYLGFNERGIWMAGFAGSFINGILMLVIFLNGRWKK